MSRLHALVALAVVLAAAACHDARTEPPALAPLQRLADGASPAAGPVALGDEWRIALGGRPLHPLLVHPSEPVPPEGRRTYAAPLPPELAAARAIVAHTYVHPATGAPAHQRTLLVSGEAGRVMIPVDFGDLPAGSTADVAAAGVVATELSDADLVGPPLRLPPGARLELAAGVQAEAWELPGAIRFAVHAVEDGGEHELWSVVLDPAARAADRGWRPAAVPLDALAGRTVRLAFRARAADGSTPSASVPLWGDPTVLAPAPPPPPPNVLLVSLDTLRADAVGAYGARYPTTPRLDAEVAARGTLFERVTAPFPLTLPSHLSLLTGLYYRSHGVRRLGEALAPSVGTLAEALRAGGWATAAFTEDGFLFADAGVDRGFASYHENKAPQGTGHAADTFGRGAAWIGAHADRPFFLFLHTYQVHAPYFPPAAYRTLFADADAIADPVARDHLRYLQEARVADDALGGVLDALEAAGVAERTLVVVTADHGEEFLEHGQRFHGYQLYDETLRVPLIVRWPGRIAAGRRIGAAVSLVDLAPTLLELLGLPALPRTDGVSLVPLLRDPAAAPARPAVFSEAMSGERVLEVDLVAAHDAAHACTRHVVSGTLECYDLARDPGEHSPVPPESTPPPLRAALDAFAARPVARGTTATGPDAATRRNLEALGYVVGDGGTVGPAP